MRSLVFVLIISWIFSGWPQIYNFPPGIQKAQAAAPNFQAAGTVVKGTGAITVAWPAHQIGDVALLFVESENQTISLTTANGFVEVAAQQGTGTGGGANATRLAVYWARAISTSMASPVVADSGVYTYGVILTYRGIIATGNPYDVTAGSVTTPASTTTTFPAVTTTVVNDLIVLAAAVDLDANSSAVWSAFTNANLSGIAERYDNTVNTNDGNGLGIADGTMATINNIGTTAGTHTSSITAQMTIALKPVPISTPSVSTQAAGSVEATTATGNGTIDTTGGENASAWGVCYKTSSGCTTADSTAAGSGSGGTGAFTASMTGLSPGITYYIKAYATNSAGTGYGNEVTILTKPAAPTSLNFTSVTETTLRLNWTAPTGAVSYKVERCTGTGCSSWAELATGVTNVYYDDTGRTGNTIYRYQVRATNATGDSAYSSGAEQLMLPGAPTALNFPIVQQTSLRVAWTAPTGGATSYKVESCSGSGCSNFSQIASGVTNAYYDNSSLTCNTLYRYQVRATNVTPADGAYSSIAEQTTSACGLSAAIEVRAQNYTTSVSTITFPNAAPETTVSQPYNDIDGSGNPQTFGGAGTAKPVVTLYNGGGSTLTIWYNITTFTNGIVSSENYLVNAKGAACADASCITGSATFDADTTTGTTIATGAGNEKDLYLKAVLSAVAGKSGNSTLTILGETQ